jgi:hypothetical protein
MEKLKASESDIAYMEQIDPSGKRWNWLLRGRREGWFSQTSVPEIQSALKRFNRLSTSPIFRMEKHHPDLNTYTWEALGALLMREGNLKSNKQRSLEYEGCEVIYTNDEATVYKVLTPRGAELAGTGSTWCTTANPQTASGYLKDGPLYIAHIWGQPYAQIHPERMEWNTAANLVTKQNLMDTDVWVDKVGYEIFLAAANASQDLRLRRALLKLPLVEIANPGDSRLAALLEPRQRISRKRENELIKSGQIPLGYFRRFRKQRDPETEAYLAQRGTPQTCVDYLETVSIGAASMFEKRIRTDRTRYARFINYTQPTTFDFTNDPELFQAWMCLGPNVLNPSATRMLCYVEADEARKYLKACNTTSSTYHRQLISAKKRYMAELVEYEREVLGAIQPKTLDYLIFLNQEVNRGVHVDEAVHKTFALVWVDFPELRHHFEFRSLFGIVAFAGVLEGHSEDLERWILELEDRDTDFDFGVFRNYIAEHAQPGVSDAAVLKMMNRRRGYSTAGGSLGTYMNRYPAGPEKRAFSAALLKSGLNFNNGEIIRRSILNGGLRPHDIVEVLLQMRSPAESWLQIVSELGEQRVLVGTALRLQRLGCIKNLDWDILTGWRVSPYVRKLLTSKILQPTQKSLIWIASQGLFHGFDPESHPDLVHFEAHGLQTCAEIYAHANRHKALQVMPPFSTTIEWKSWGSYERKGAKWFKS